MQVGTMLISFGLRIFDRNTVAKNINDNGNVFYEYM